MLVKTQASSGLLHSYLWLTTGCTDNLDFGPKSVFCQSYCRYFGLMTWLDLTDWFV